MRWCIDMEEPECNGPECGHADDCPFFKAEMEEDSSLADALREYNGRKKGGAE